MNSCFVQCYTCIVEPVERYRTMGLIFLDKKINITLPIFYCDCIEINAKNRI